MVNPSRGNCKRRGQVALSRLQVEEILRATAEVESYSKLRR